MVFSTQFLAVIGIMDCTAPQPAIGGSAKAGENLKTQERTRTQRRTIEARSRARRPDYAAAVVKLIYIIRHFGMPSAAAVAAALE
jgi:hypothetical protein